MSQHIRIQIGPTVKHYGQFHLKRFGVFRGDQEFPANIYSVTLDNGDGSYESLGTIKKEKSTLPELLSYLHNWQHHQYNQIYRTKQLLDQAKDDEARARFEGILNDWEPRYLRVDRAIRELEPDYQPDESIYDVPQDSTEQNKGECHFE